MHLFVSAANIQDQYFAFKKTKEFVSTMKICLYPVRRRKWQPTPLFLPGESQEQRSLVGCRPWGRTESDTTEAT